MAEAQDLSPPLEGREQLVEVLANGAKPRAEWKIGTEHEKFAFEKDVVTPVGFAGERGIEALLKGMQRHSDEYAPSYEGERLIGLKKPSACGKFAASITLEPGGQFELSGAPLDTIHQTKAEISAHFEDVAAVAGPMGIGFLGNGYSPKFSLDDTPRMPKGRYDVMRAYMPKVGGAGLAMMHATATVQVNLDFASEADMVRKFQVGLALQPLATALFANSAFKEGAVSGYQSYRSEVWMDVDPARCGMLPFVFEPGMGFEAYVDYALNVPMYFIYREGRYLEAGGGSFADFMAGRIETDKEIRPTMDDWLLHLTTLFPEVRLKQFLEMRGADCGPMPYLTALPAFWTGLLYHGPVLDAAAKLVGRFEFAAFDELRRRVPREGLKAELGAYKLIDIAKEVLAMAHEGLKARDCLDEAGESEAVYLEPLLEIAEDGWSQSDKLVDRFETVWGRDINRLYREEAY